MASKSSMALIANTSSSSTSLTPSSSTGSCGHGATASNSSGCGNPAYNDNGLVYNGQLTYISWTSTFTMCNCPEHPQYCLNHDLLCRPSSSSCSRQFNNSTSSSALHRPSTSCWPTSTCPTSCPMFLASTACFTLPFFDFVPSNCPRGSRTAADGPCERSRDTYVSSHEHIICFISISLSYGLNQFLRARYKRFPTLICSIFWLYWCSTTHIQVCSLQQVRHDLFTVACVLHCPHCLFYSSSPLNNCCPQVRIFYEEPWHSSSFFFQYGCYTQW